MSNVMYQAKDPTGEPTAFIHFEERYVKSDIVVPDKWTDDKEYIDFEWDKHFASKGWTIVKVQVTEIE
jgi:hypothetical protein